MPAAVPSGPGAHQAFTGLRRSALLLGYALLVALRLPGVWAEGRFLDEEATVFLAYAWHFPWADALLRPFGGYLNLAANGSTLLVARLVQFGLLRLEVAPYLTMGLAFGAQLLPALLVLTGRAPWLRSRAAVLAALLLPVLAPASEEVFLNVLHIQFHLALCVALILALDPPQSRGGRLRYGAILLLAPLCGPGAIVLLPLFAVRAAVDRDPRRLRQFAVLGLGAAVQLLVFYGDSPVRGLRPDPLALAATFFVRLVALPALGPDTAYGLGAVIHNDRAAGGVGWWWAAAAAAALLGMLLALAARRRDAAPWLLLAALGVAAATFGLGMAALHPAAPFSVQAGQRYNYLPQVLLGLALVALAARGGRTAPIPAALAALMLFTGALGFRHPQPDFARGPSWPAEVARWRRDPSYPLAVWPRPWRADLSSAARPCPPPSDDPSPDPARSAAPRYCESGWAAPFHRAARRAGY